MDSVENPSEQVPHPGGQNKSDEEARENRARAFAKDEGENVTLLCAEGHANSNFAGAQNDNVADGAVNTDRSQQQPE